MGFLKRESLAKLHKFFDLDVLSWEWEMSSLEDTDLSTKDERIWWE